MPRKEHQPTDENRAEVQALASFGVPQEDISKYIGVSHVTLRKHYRRELDFSVVTTTAKALNFLFTMASGAALKDGATYADCLRANMFWGKTRIGLRDVAAIDHTSSDGSMSPKGLDISKLSDAAIAELMAAQEAAGTQPEDGTDPE